MSDFLSFPQLFRYYARTRQILSSELEDPIMARVVAMSPTQLRAIPNIDEEGYVEIVFALDSFSSAPKEGMSALERLTVYYTEGLPATLLAQIDLQNPAKAPAKSELIMLSVYAIASHLGRDFVSLKMAEIANFSFTDLIRILTKELDAKHNIDRFAEEVADRVTCLKEQLQKYGFKLSPHLRSVS